MSYTFTPDELFLIRTALRAKIAQTRREVAAGETLGLRLEEMERLFSKVTDLHERTFV